jgi:Pyridoxamine 5'-phosphate oxidase
MTPPDADHAAIARAIVDANVYMTLGTADAEGRPWVSPVFFAASGYRDYYWISSPDARHSRNLAVRPELSIVVFDSQIPVGTGQAVYMEAAAEQLAGDEIAAGLEIYPGGRERGARAIDPDEVREPGPYRLYRATVTQHWILDPDRSPDQRAPVTL